MLPHHTISANPQRVVYIKGILILKLAGELKKNSPLPSEFLDETPVIKNRLTIEQQLKFINRYIICIHRRYFGGKNELLKKIALEFRIKYHFNKGKEGYGTLWGERITFRKDELIGP